MFSGTFGIMHWVILAFIVFLLFGNRLPSVMRSLGQGVVEFKKGLQGIEDEVKNSTSKIEESKPAATEKAKQSQTEPAQR
jgi:sec-independent protein translocase protein TatA